MFTPSATSIPAVRKSCIRPAHNELLTIRSTSPEHITTITDDNGVLNLACIFVHALTGVELYTRTIHAVGTFTLYGVMCDRFPGKRYLVQWAPRLQRFGCSCTESRKFGACKHCAEVEEYTSRGVLYV